MSDDDDDDAGADKAADGIAVINRRRGEVFPQDQLPVQIRKSSL